MFETNANADETVSRRNVLKTMGGLIAGSTALVGFGAGRGAAETEEGLQIEVREMTEEYIILRVRVSNPDGPHFDDPDAIYFGCDYHFTVEEDTVSLPENAEEVLANPIEMEQLDEETYRMYFRTGDIDWPEEDEEVTLGFGVFTDQDGTLFLDQFATELLPNPRVG